MDFSQILKGQHLVASPDGHLLACHFDGKLRVGYARNLERFRAFDIRAQSKDIIALKWSPDGTLVAVHSANCVEIIRLNESDGSIRLHNGTGGLGRFASADFLDTRHLLTVWEFGKAQLWDLETCKSTDLGDLKTTGHGSCWQSRSGLVDSNPRVLALLLRPAADDLLALHFVGSQDAIVSGIGLPTTDTQSLSWSPDGRWLAILDTAIATPSVYFYTPDGHLFRSHSTSQSDAGGLGVKSLVWSGDSRIVALSMHDSTVELLSAKSFAPMALIGHSLTIDQRSLPEDQRAPSWQECVSAAKERSYSQSTPPFSPPLSCVRPSNEPSDIGIAEACFNCDGSYLATRDQRMLNTVWLWNMATLSAHAVLVQHSNVRKMHWHPSRAENFMLDCAEGIAYIFNASTPYDPPGAVALAMPGAPTLAWLPTRDGGKAHILAASKSSFRILYPEGRDRITPLEGMIGGAERVDFDEGASEDSLLDVLTGRKPLPAKTEQSYTEMVNLEVEAVDDMVGRSDGLDDTFREKHKRSVRGHDPLDDSDIF